MIRKNCVPGTTDVKTHVVSELFYPQVIHEELTFNW